MAKVVEQMVVIRLSRLVKDADVETTLLASESFGTEIEAVVAELVEAGTLVEVEVVEND